MAKILFLAANPQNSTRLRLDDEVRAIDSALRDADPTGEDFAMIQWWEVRPLELSTLLLRHRPEVVHFCGHGNENQLIFTHPDGNTVPVDDDYLRRVFEIVKDRVKCVVLNACYSDTVAHAIVSVVPAVVGMSGPVTDKLAIQFAATFYKSLGYGKDVDSAFKLATAEVRWATRLGVEVQRDVKRVPADQQEDRVPMARFQEGVNGGDVRIFDVRREVDSADALASPRSLARGREAESSRGSTLPDAGRLQAYLELGRCLKPLARYDRPEPLTGYKLRAVSQSMRDWYFDCGGWLYLAEICRAPYFDLKDALQTAIKSASETDESKLAEMTQVALVIRLASALRKAVRESLESPRTHDAHLG